ncbi:hypothetical protein HYG87_01970 [Methanobacterium alkalithermotolerans]|uniref:Uncharacterized protein n=1 Tax=Methanobacterium alkalithermotolerans TaxID=2731220 RepID=A0A8T8K6E1_9EURY|nr:hypothetical protein [Methanobacterium alkalithermotolerans]QUH22620.1 hypothetical protein HYG87_01970 [Methanobacterium alkalithermotolerans]
MELILGHNQFIGISHISEDRSREREKKFSNIENIYKVAENASDLGYKGMVIETHPRMIEFFNYYKENQTFDMDFYLQVPYVVGYVKKMNEKGIKGLLSDLMGQTGFIGAGGLALKGASNFLKRDYMALAMSILKLEVSPFTDVNIKSLLLHNVFTDLLLSLKIEDAFIKYESYVKDDLGIDPGLITLNFPMLKNNLDSWNIKPKYVMTPLNPSGYDMNPSKEIVEKNIVDYNGKIIAMNVLGGGAFTVKDSSDYLKRFININQCVIGASSGEHLKELIETF